MYDGDRTIKTAAADGDFAFSADGLEHWSPENPKLYTLKIKCGDAALERSFGVRRLAADGTRLLLNGRKYFLRGACEHCCYPDTVHPNHDKAHYRRVIKKLKSLGFNHIRFHTYIPEEEYMQAADELGMLMHVECPNNTTVSEWREIVRFCRKHPSVVIYCCGNELLIDEPFIEYLRECAKIVHEETDALFAPMSAALNISGVSRSRRRSLKRSLLSIIRAALKRSGNSAMFTALTRTALTAIFQPIAIPN